MSFAVRIARLNADTSECLQHLRIAALNCLAILPTVIRYDMLHPLKSSVIRELDKALDDRKRDVRKAAVDAR